METTGNAHEPRTLLLGIGNTLLSDDGIGVHVITALEADADVRAAARLNDGGTIGLALLGDIEDCEALIAVDAMQLDQPPGTLRVFTGEAMDLALAGRKRTAHEVALSDLLQAAALIGRRPSRRALVGIQPQSVDWGLVPTAEVAAAIPRACAAVAALLSDWRHAGH
jgi:hydrogenase maturation protease